MSSKQLTVRGTNDSETWECNIDEEQARAFKTFCDLIDDVDDDDESTVLQVPEYSKETFEHALEANALLPKDAEKDQEEANPAYAYLRELEVSVLVAVVKLIDFLNHARLLTLTCKAIASQLKDKSVLEIEAMLDST